MNAEFVGVPPKKGKFPKDTGEETVIVGNYPVQFKLVFTSDVWRHSLVNT